MNNEQMTRTEVLADLTRRMHAAKRHERRELVLEACALGARFTERDGKAVAVEA